MIIGRRKHGIAPSLEGRMNMEKKDYIYMDNAATTPVSDSVLEAMLPFLREQYGNASAVYRIGRDAHQAVEDARRRIARGYSP